MKCFKLSIRRENEIIGLGIIGFWFLFWLLNVIDKFIGKGSVGFVGKDRLSQFVDYFLSIGIEDPTVAGAMLVLITILEIVAFAFSAFAIYYFLNRDKVKARGALFYTILMTLIIFSLFAIGDQIFGDRLELLEHSLYWIIAVLSWFVYTHFQMSKKGS